MNLRRTTFTLGVMALVSAGIVMIAWTDEGMWFGDSANGAGIYRGDGAGTYSAVGNYLWLNLLFDGGLTVNTKGQTYPLLTLKREGAIVLEVDENNQLNLHNGLYFEQPATLAGTQLEADCYSLNIGAGGVTVVGNNSIDGNLAFEANHAISMPEDSSGDGPLRG